MILALLVGCALRRQELASLEIATIRMRERRRVLADLKGKRRRIRTVSIPVWGKPASSVADAAPIDRSQMRRFYMELPPRQILDAV